MKQQLSISEALAMKDNPITKAMIDKVDGDALRKLSPFQQSRIDNPLPSPPLPEIKVSSDGKVHLSLEHYREIIRDMRYPVCWSFGRTTILTRCGVKEVVVDA